MATIVTRAGLGSPLSNNQVDSNFNNLNTDKAELSGATFTGQIVAPSLDISGNIDVDGTTNLDVVDIDGAVDMASTLQVDGAATFTTEITANGGIALGDSDKATFGASDDLQIYHDGSNSYIKDDGTGSLKIRGVNLSLQSTSGESYIDCVNDGAVYVYHNNSAKLTTTSTGIDVTGTATMDGLSLLDGLAVFRNLNDSPVQFISGTLGDKEALTFERNGGAVKGSIEYQQSPIGFNIGTDTGHAFRLKTGGTQRLNIDSNGDISFYEDTGTTPKLFWDASAESLGIGTSSPARKIQTEGSGVLFANSGGTHEVLFGDNNYRYFSLFTPSSPEYMSIRTGTTDLLTVKADGNVGIGISPSHPLHITKEIAGYQAYFNNDNGSAQGIKVRIKSNDSGNFNMLELVSASSGSDVTAMVVRDDGNVGIGTSSPSAPLHIDAAGMGDIYSGLIQNSTTDTDHYNVVRFMQGASGSATGYIGTGGSATGNPAFRNSFVVGTQTSSPLVFTTSDTERMRIDSSGRVGIGTSSPSAKLDVNSGGSGNTASFKSGAANVNEYAGITIHAQTISNDDWYGSEIRSINTGGTPNVLNPRLGFFTQDIGTYLPANRTEKMSILGNGYVGIGTSSPSRKLSVFDSVDAYNLELSQTGAYNSGNQSGIVFSAKYNSGGSVTDLASIRGGKENATDGNFGGNLRFYTRVHNGSDTERMRIDSSGNVGFGIGNSKEAMIQSTNSGRVASNPAYSFNGDLDTGMFNPQVSNTVAFATGGSERMRIDSSGNVGIGTSSPSSYPIAPNLVVDAGTNGGITVKSGSSNYGGVFFADGTTGSEQYRGFIQYNHNYAGSTDELLFGTSGAERMRIDSSGNVGIGTSSPTSLLTLGTDTFSSAATNTSALYTSTTDGMVALADGYTWNTRGGAERMRIDSSGNVGIGTSSPTNVNGYTTLNVGAGSIGSIIKIDGANSGHYHRILNNNGQLFIQADQGNTTGSSAIVFGVDSTERARIDSSGNLLVGLSSISSNPNQGYGVAISGSGSHGNIKTVGNGTHTHFSVINASNLVGSITSSSSATAYNTSSDQRLKENIADADDAGSKIDAIQVRKYDWKADGSHQDYGMIAQELLEVAPEAVSQGETEEEMMGVDYSKLVPMLIKEIQSLRNRVAQLEE